MNKAVASLCAITLAASFCPTVSAQDEYERRVVTTRISSTGTTGIGYFPTRKYYGKGFTISYGFVPVVSRVANLLSVNPVSLPADETPVNAASARVIVYSPVPAPVFHNSKVAPAPSHAAAPIDAPAPVALPGNVVAEPVRVETR